MKRFLAIVLACTLLLSLTSCGSLSPEDVKGYAQTFCRTTNSDMWNRNKAFLTSGVSEEMEARVISWFDGANYSDQMSVVIKEYSDDISSGSGTAMLLLSCSNDSLSYWVVMTLTYEKGMLFDFTYQSIDQMSEAV